MAVNISFNSIKQLIQKMIGRRYLLALILGIAASLAELYQTVSYAAEIMIEPVQACIIPQDARLTNPIRAKIAQCLGWQADSSNSICQGSYQSLNITELKNDEVRITAEKASFYREGRSQLSGDVEVHQAGQIVNAQTAYVYRDAKTNKVNKIELLGNVRYIETGKLMIARKATINPEDKSGRVEDVLYRFDAQRVSAILPSWGRASIIERFANENYLLQKVTYSTCAPEDRAWQIDAESLELDTKNSTGVARNAKLRIGSVPILYSPYLSFPTSKERKSGFLIPIVGSSNVGGFDLALPYYWNIAPNYDATITPHLYTRRGLMLGGQFRYLTENSFGRINGSFLPQDHAYRSFLNDNELAHPRLEGKSSNRWSVDLQNSTLLYTDLHLGVNFQQVSDPYYLQDFTTNLALLTERQLLRQADLTYTTEHWVYRGMAQSYQTLQPINETPISDVYQRLPQLMAYGTYDDLLFNGNFSLLGQFDYFQWPTDEINRPEGSRYHLNPILSLPQIKPWGFFTPAIELVQNNYDMYNYSYNHGKQFNRSIPRYSIDGGLYFERPITLNGTRFSQTLEPRLYYLNVPYHNQTQIPVFDSGYMIFNTDQLFRTNRFSGFDRIGDTNQFSYALSSRWISDETGGEKASIQVGQIRYFSDRRVQLCQSYSNSCIENPLSLGYLSPLAKSSPIASRAIYNFTPAWIISGDYVWDPDTKATNNGNVNFHYQPGENKIVGFGYSYLINGDITQVAYSNIQNNPLHQATVSYAWPFSDNWSTLGAYNYNISKRYEMMSFLGVQYDSCCWAMRLIGGRAFRSLDSQLRPNYNNNIYFQILLKGLGAAGNSDPSGRIRTYLPGYVDKFHR